MNKNIINVALIGITILAIIFAIFSTSTKNTPTANPIRSLENPDIINTTPTSGNQL
ncbi:hypothetical protein GW793_01265 [bacterium]|nr:hypothetical protein [bacterium]